MTIYDGPNVQAPLLKKLCGSAIPENVVSSTNTMLIQFKTDNSVARKGFTLNYFSGMLKLIIK